MVFEINLIVVEAIRGRCASFTVLTATVSEIFGGQRTPSILVVYMLVHQCVMCGLRDTCCVDYVMSVVWITSCLLCGLRHACCVDYVMPVVWITSCLLCRLRHICCVYFVMPVVWITSCLLCDYVMPVVQEE